MAMLKKGDNVNWRGAWGTQEPKIARVDVIEITRGGDKYGRPVDEVDWSECEKGNVVVTLDNGHWAYGSQLSPLPPF